jgi:hypothetical protein
VSSGDGGDCFGISHRRMLHPIHPPMAASHMLQSTTMPCPLHRTYSNSIRWFSVTMGTGIVSILLHNLPYNGIWLYWISVVFFAFNVLLFSTFLIISILRYAIYPERWGVMIRHPGQSLFLGTFPMGLATIINMIVFVCVPAWGTWAIYLVRRCLSFWPRMTTDNIRPGDCGGLMY